MTCAESSASKHAQPVGPPTKVDSLTAAPLAERHATLWSMTCRYFVRSFAIDFLEAGPRCVSRLWCSFRCSFDVLTCDSPYAEAVRSRGCSVGSVAGRWQPCRPVPPALGELILGVATVTNRSPRWLPGGAPAASESDKPWRCCAETDFPEVLRGANIDSPPDKTIGVAVSPSSVAAGTRTIRAGCSMTTR